MTRAALITVASLGLCVGFALLWKAGPWTPRPPFHIKKANREIGYSWRLNPVIDGNGRWLVHDEELNLLFLAIGDEANESLVIHGSREQLTLGTRQGKTRAFSNPAKTLFVGVPDGDVYEFHLSDGAATRLFAMASDEHGEDANVIELLYNHYDGPDRQQLQAMLEEFRN